MNQAIPSKAEENLRNCKAALEDHLKSRMVDGDYKVIVRTCPLDDEPSHRSLTVVITTPTGREEAFYIAAYSDDDDPHWFCKCVTPQEKILRSHALTITGKLLNPAPWQVVEGLDAQLAWPMVLLEDLDSAREDEVDEVYKDLRWFYKLGGVYYRED